MAVWRRAADQRAFSLVELLTALLIMAILATISVPAAAVQRRYSVPLAARHVAVVLRFAQTTAQVEDVTVRFQLTGSGWTVHRSQDPAGEPLASGDFGGVTCDSNYPGDCVEFDDRGYPLSTSSAPRAGTFTFSGGGVQAAVVLQLTGRVRVK